MVCTVSPPIHIYNVLESNGVKGASSVRLKFHCGIWQFTEFRVSTIGEIMGNELGFDAVVLRHTGFKVVLRHTGFKVDVLQGIIGSIEAQTFRLPAIGYPGKFLP